MKDSIKQRKNRLLALFLSALMVPSIVALSSCKDEDESSSSSSSSTESTTGVDDGIIKNATFKTFNTNDGLNLIGTSVTGWTRSVNSTTSGSASSSKAASGIIDTAKWTDLTTNTVDNFTGVSEDTAKENWDGYTAKDKLDYYKAWEKANTDKDKDVEDLDFYEDFNIKAEDVPDCANPGTRENAEDTNVLMIHNQYPATDSTSKYKNAGTAQKFTSASTVTIPAGAAAAFSVWVKTSDLTSSSSNGDVQEAVGKGAYISVTHTVGSKTLDAFEVKNINTDEWKQYSFQIRGSSYADTTFTIVLGLGKGGGTDYLEYVNGYAFFDDIECKLIDADEYDETGADRIAGFASTKDEKTVDAYKNADADSFAMNFHKDFAAIGGLSNLVDVNKIAPTTEENNGGTKFTAAQNDKGLAVYPTFGDGIVTAGDVKQIYANAAALNGTNDEYVQSVYDNYFKDKTFLADSEMLMLLSKNGAAYTAELNNGAFSLKSGEYKAISFYVKTSDLNGFTGASITLNNGLNKTTISSIDTTTIDAVSIGAKDDVYEGWQKIIFFVANETETTGEIEFNFTLNYGPTTVMDTTRKQYYAGFAAFASFEICELDEIEYASAKSDAYTKTVSLKTTEKETDGDGGFDAAASVPSNAIETGYANPKNYKGVYSGSDYLTGNGTGNNAEINTNATAGLLNKEHEDNYGEILTALGGTGATWNSVFGSDTTQPLVIYNAANSKPYGFIGSSTSIAAESYVTVSTRVKVSNTKAYVYLVDMNDDTHESLLSIDRKLTYWYDDEGNILSKDPSSDGFNAKKHTAFKLQPNGLYKVSANWEFASAINANVYYANFANYEADENGNLLVAEGGVEYDYNAYWNNDGRDGIAFYGYNKATNTAFADSKKTLAVKDLASVASLQPRYAAKQGEGLFFEISDTNGEWATVSFYIHAGSTAKNYRLEVWNGARDGAANAEASYVIFDAYKPDSVSDATAYADLLNEKKELVSEDKYFESVFSFYDSAKFLRYDETMDENGVGNSYESYTQSTYTSGVAYLKYESKTEYQLYADYALSEVTVAADVEESEDETDEEEETETNPTNVALLASSIIIAAVLLLAVVSLVVRKIVEKARKTRGTQVRKPKKAKKNKKND